MVTNAADVSFSTDFQACLMAGRVFPQIARLHHRSPFSLPSSVAHIDLQAMRSGLATFTLPKLKPGKHKVTASFAAAGAYNAAKATKTLVVKVKKQKK